MSPSTSSRLAGPSPTAQTDQAFLRTLFRQGEATRAQIARETGISKPTISEAAARLEKAGLILPVGEVGPAGRGRAAVLYGPARSFGHAAAVVIERGRLVVRCLDLNGGRLFDETVTESLPFQEAVGATADLLASNLPRLGTPRRHAAISVAAPVHPTTHVVRPFGEPLRSDQANNLRAALGLDDTPDVLIDNDVNWAARAHADLCPGTFLYVYLGAGVGSSLIIDGHIYPGVSGAAGEIGLVPLRRGRPLMQELVESAIGHPEGSSIDLDRAQELFSAGPSPDTEVVTEALTDAIVIAVTMLDPGCVILGGPMSTAPGLVEAVTQGVDAQAFSPVDVVLGDPEETSPVEGVTRAAVTGLRATALAAVG